MKLVKLEGFARIPVYINPLNIKAIGCLEGSNARTWIEFVGDDDDHFFTIEQPIAEVVKLIEECEV